MLLYTYFPRLAYSILCGCSQLLWLYFQRSCPSAVWLVHEYMYVLINRFFALDISHSNAFYCLFVVIPLRCSSIAIPFFSSFLWLLLHVLWSCKACYFLVTQSNQYVSSSFWVMENIFLVCFIGHIPTSFPEYLKLNLTLIY